jgi:RNA polymerase sigma-70 factor (ECF subfamily)
MNDDFALRQFHPMRRRLIELARALLGTSAEAEDTVQDAWLRVHAGVPPGLVSVEAWLATVVRHLAVDRLRRRRLEQAWQHAETAQTDPERHVAASAERLAAQRLDAAAALRRIADVLSPPEAAALLLHELFDVDFAAIAASAGKGEAACRQLVHRAWRKVRGGTRRRRDAGDAEALFRVCMLAVQARDARVLHAVLARPLVTARALTRPVPQRAASPRTECTLAQVGGRHALVLMLDGVVLCALPVGVVGEGEHESIL